MHCVFSGLIYYYILYIKVIEYGSSEMEGQREITCEGRWKAFEARDRLTPSTGQKPPSTRATKGSPPKKFTSFDGASERETSWEGSRI